MTSDPTIATQNMIQSAEQYLARVETYEMVTLQDLAESLGVKVRVVYRWLPLSEWERLRRQWILDRLRRAIEDFRAEDKKQKFFTPKNVASYAGMPSTVVRRFFPEDEWQTLRASFPTTRPTKRGTSQARSAVVAEYVLQAEKYIETTERYEALNVKAFAEFLGVPSNRVHEWLPTYQWEILRNRWIENRLRQAMDAAYAEARTQSDFNVKDIARRAGMPTSTVHRMLPEEEWQARRATLPAWRKSTEMMSSYLPQAQSYLARTERYEDVTVQKFAASLGLSVNMKSSRQWEELRITWIKKRLSEAMDAAYAEAKTQDDFTVADIARRTGIPRATVEAHLPTDEWRARQEALPPKRAVWLQRMREAMDRVYAQAKTQEDFTITKIAELADIPPKVVRYYATEEWQVRRATLPTTRERVLAALQKLVRADISEGELTRQRVVELAGVNDEKAWSWFNHPFAAALREVALRTRKQEIDRPPAGTDVRTFSGGWVDISGSSWDLRPAGAHLLRKERLRGDLADIVWPLLQEELRSPDIPPSTIALHYQGFVKAGAVLGETVPDVRCATLEAVQRVWMNVDMTQITRQIVRPRLAEIFEALMRLAEHRDTIDGGEMLRIAVWLRDDVKVGRPKAGEEFLSEAELNAVIEACLGDIVAGIAYTDANPNLLAVSAHPLLSETAAAVVWWGVALMILIMAFTGLRRESVLKLKTNDWAKVHASLYVLAWKHNKKVEENAAVLPSLLAQELQLFVERTAPVRKALETEAVFLGSTIRGHWEVMPLSQFHARLREFVKRHNLEREGKPLLLTNTVLRRTYVTRALYEGRPLAALRSQLGHLHLDSTLRYAKFDEYEHPAEVGAPLDEYGRKALVLWHTPLLLDELAPDERATILGAKTARQQDVGLCRHKHCVKAVQGSPPPCSLCEHLVTCPEFFEAWKMEHHLRKLELEMTAAEPGSEMVLAQKRYLFERFEANFAYIQERFSI